ncbi:MAG TPA: hypothetical protein VGR38_02010 [Candidatus Polarisedimenticolia bacterium]|nr:hypothetical protein [Candidatus Polarisedimenticolia bacterium]
MNRPRIAQIILVLLMISGTSASIGPVLASCGSAPVFHGFTSSFEQCGPNAVAFAWFHGRAVQRVIACECAANQGNTAAGHDSGGNQNAVEGMYVDGPNGGAANGSYLGNTDFANGGYDGCILNIPEAPTPSGCRGGPDFGVLDYVIAGVDPSAPNLARMAVLSVDYNEFLAAWILDNAGAPAVDGDPCGDDALSTLPQAVNCTPIPAPAITGISTDATGANVALAFGDVSGIPILDDCAIAETRATNCPRNLYAGRVLMFKLGACIPGTEGTFDRRVYVYPPSPPAGTLAVHANWLTFSLEDQNYNGILDVGEDGSHGGVVNGFLDPFIIAGTAPATTVVRMSRLSGSTACLYLGMTIGLDANRVSIDPPTDTLFGEMVLAPVVSVNPTPLNFFVIAAADTITSVTASRARGEATVEWTTGAEISTAGFNLFGSKRHGGEVQLNAALIPAKEGTNGRGASYSLTVDASRLRGAGEVLVELVRTDGSRVRSSPASF